ncbi:unnamed protein product [Notodromas monacha]|uniref:Protein Wnt n=1 Tax=Notodromas monacha TaxID=399045 RepID=A0A7R9BMF9_9CRUS|nr:unnamed protein product [Notodromas monacha]CAG0917097.1 unnamed protein product [Notodromas monacha]
MNSLPLRLQKIYAVRSKETAYIYAVTSAGVVHSVTAACGLGELAECSCDAERNGGRTTAEGWKWGGCSAEIGYGREFGRRLVDSPDEAKIRAPGVKRGIRRRAAMNLLNNEAGRVAVAQLMKNQCRCHGISGSCELKTCWRSLPPFQEVGARLKDRYENSVAISQINELPFKSRGIRNKKRRRRGNTNRKHAGLNSASLLALSDAPAVRNSSSRGTMLSPFWTNTNKNNNNNNAENIDDSRSTSKRRRSSQRRQVASPTSHHGASENKLGNEVPLKLPGMGDKLVYIHESLNYCEGDKRRQIPSTSGRRCSRDSTKGDSCDVLCCGRGYNTQVQ